MTIFNRQRSAHSDCNARTIDHRLPLPPNIIVKSNDGFINAISISIIAASIDDASTDAASINDAPMNAASIDDASIDDSTSVNAASNDSAFTTTVDDAGFINATPLDDAVSIDSTSINDATSINATSNDVESRYVTIKMKVV